MITGIRHIPLINGIEPSWANLTINIAGVPAIAVRNIEYNEEQVTENQFGAGQMPVSRGYGNIEASGSITLLMSEVEKIRPASVTGRLQDIAPFDIVCSYVPPGGTTIITHKLRNCQFTNNPVANSQGDVASEVQLNLILSHIDWN